MQRLAIVVPRLDRSSTNRQTARMAKRDQVPADVLHRQAQVAALAALASGSPIEGVHDAVAPADVRGHFTPDVAILELAVTALDLASPPGTGPLEYEGLRERLLPERQFRGRTEHHRSQYALYAAAAMRGGLRPDLLNDAGLWQPRLWVYAVYALIIYSRAAAERRNTAVPNVAMEIADRHMLTDDVHGLRGGDQPA